MYDLSVKASSKNPGSWTDDDFPRLLKRRSTGELAGWAGRRYASVVKWCLEAGDAREGGQSTAELLMEYEEKVIKPLMECCV